MEKINLIQEKINAAIKEIDEMELGEHVSSFDFCCSKLDEEYMLLEEKLCNTQLFPTIYWFEIISDCSLNLKDELNKFRKENSSIKVPPTNKKECSENILYVGKVRNKFSRRISQHLGYGSPGTWSLQLKHWTIGLSTELNLRLNYIQLSEDINDITLAILEDCIAKKLKPILGKHSL